MISLAKMSLATCRGGQVQALSYNFIRRLYLYHDASVERTFYLYPLTYLSLGFALLGS